MRQINLDIGGFHFGTAPLRIATLLGSCVSVTLWHPRLHTGGMCHIQFPGRSPNFGTGHLDPRYAADAIARFELAVKRHHAPLREYTVKLFGGGNMFPERETSLIDVGSKNIAEAKRLLAERNLCPVVEHVGGAGHRKLVLDLTNGDVWLAFRNLQPEKESLCD
jgi:chemotaxis protein CheD